MALDNKTSLLNTPLLSSSPRAAREHFLDSPFKHSRKDTSMDDSEQLTDGTLTKRQRHTVSQCPHQNHFVSFCALTDSSLDQSELVAELLKELSNHNERVEERKGALCELLKLIRENTLQVWDEHFKTILLLLLETMGDREVNALSPKQNPEKLIFKSSPSFKLESLSIFPARHPNVGSTSAEGDPRQAALEVQELCRAHHHEGPGGSQRPSQGGASTQTHTSTHLSLRVVKYTNPARLKSYTTTSCQARS